MGSAPIHVIVYGLGPIGRHILKSCLQTERFHVMGAVDINPEIVGKDIGELAGVAPTGVKVVRSLEEVDTRPAGGGRKLALHATGSNLQQVWPQYQALFEHGYSVVSTCEQLSFPWHRYPDLSKTMDEYAKRKRQFLIGTGVNPGFVMDSLTLFATTVTRTLKRIRVSRVVDVSRRRIPLQQKVGIGMTPEEFRRLAAENRIGHVGLEESLRLIAYGLGLTLNEVNNSIEPTIAEKEADLAIGPLKPGQVSGLHQVSSGVAKEGIPIELDLVMSIDVEQQDRLELETEELGTMELVIPQGIFGDTATVNVVLNTAKTLMGDENVGLLTMADIRMTRNVQ